MNANQLMIRLIRNTPPDVVRALNPKELQALCERAIDNGWTDPEWLSSVASLGVEHPNIRDAAALYVSQLRRAIDTQCPEERTPTPPPIEHARQDIASEDVRLAALAHIRGTLAKRGEGV